MKIALQRMPENRRVFLHNRLKILNLLEYEETQGVGIATRIKYTLNLAKLASMLEKQKALAHTARAEGLPQRSRLSGKSDIRSRRDKVKSNAICRSQNRRM
jgi:hypothetical protein